MRRLLISVAILLVCALYIADLTGMGMIGPDEPRYADIGRAMAHTGDWVTPRLWGHPWFEKPALLYWMTALGFDLGLNSDLAPRLPVALLSLGFLAFYWSRLRQEWGAEAASYSTAMLATSGGWLTYSHIAVTDLPLAAFFSAAVLLSLPWIRTWERRMLPAAAACLGVATLAKGLVPVVLFLPVIAFPLFTPLRRRALDWLRPAPLLAFAIVSLPWYLLVTLRNGAQFLSVFFVQQQFARLSSSTLQHVQPFWFYVPVLLVLLYPWFPLIFVPALAYPKDFRKDSRVRLLASIVLFGFVFFSAALNKLFGYLLPLLPSALALVGLGVARSRKVPVALVASLILVSVLPSAALVAPRVLAARSGLIVAAPLASVFLSLAISGTAGWALMRLAPRQAFGAVATAAACLFLAFQFMAFPGFDQASARSEWSRTRPACTPAGPRDLLYGLYYYSGRELPKCAILNNEGTAVVNRRERQ